jgi:hypothetical protein
MAHIPNTNLIAQTQINSVHLSDKTFDVAQDRLEVVEIGASGVANTVLRVPRTDFMNGAPSMVLPSEDGKFVAVNIIHGEWPNDVFEWDFYDVERKMALPPYSIPSTQHLDIDRATSVSGPTPDRSHRIAT